MTAARRRAVRGALAPYAALGARVRAHTAIRWISAPLAEVESLIPRRGRILDFGCGHGLLSLVAARGAPRRSVHGVDVDEAKIEAARRAAGAAGLGGRATFDVVDGGWRPDPGSFDVVLVTDVLYLLGPEAALDAVSMLARAVRPGGRLLIKEMAPAPRWKVRVNLLQERLAIDVVGYTKGAAVAPVPIGALAERVRAEGFGVTVRRLDRGYPHPHAIVVADRVQAGA